VFEGLHPFVFQRMRDIFDIRIFVSTDEALRRFWKIRRDTRERGHAVEKVTAEMDRRQDDSAQFIQPQEQFADWVLEYSPALEGDPASLEAKPEASWLKARHLISSRIVEIEDLMEELKRVSTVTCAWSMESNLKRQVLGVQGAIPSKQIEMIAENLFPELSDLTGIQPEWEADLKGVNQLIFLCLLFGLEKS